MTALPSEPWPPCNAHNQTYNYSALYMKYGFSSAVNADHVTSLEVPHVQKDITAVGVVHSDVLTHVNAVLTCDFQRWGVFYFFVLIV